MKAKVVDLNLSVAENMGVVNVLGVFPWFPDSCQFLVTFWFRSCWYVTLSTLNLACLKMARYMEEFGLVGEELEY